MRLILLAFVGVFIFPLDALAASLSDWGDLVQYIRTQQQAFHRELASALRAIQTGGLYAVWGMVSLSFLYGIFHAAGPGHGKAVIGTYLVSQESKLRKGIGLSFASAFVQGLSAIILVEVVVGLMGLTNRQGQALTPILEQVSFILIALIGLFIIKRAVGIFLLLRKNDHAHDHGHCSTCGHSHAPSPDNLTGDASWKETLGVILSVGIRPCSGSVLILIFAELISLRWAGIASVLAISLGTAITVSLLAIIAIYFRKTALYLAQKQGNQTVQKMSIAIIFICGSFITLLGVSLFIDANSASHPLF